MGNESSFGTDKFFKIAIRDLVEGRYSIYLLKYGTKLTVMFVFA